MNARLELHDRVNAIALHLELDFLVATCVGGGNIKGLDLPPTRLSKTLVHLVQIACEDGGLVAACTGANLNDDVLVVGRIGRNEHELDVLFDLRETGLDIGDLGLRELLHIRIDEHLFSSLKIILGRKVRTSFGNQRALVRVFLSQAVVFPLVGDNAWVGHLSLKLFVSLDDLLELLAHVRFLHVRVPH